MRGAVIVDAVRTPLGRRDGVLRERHPVELAAGLLSALERRNELDPRCVDDVVLGCVMQVGEQAANIARNAVLAAGWPESVPGTTVDRQCGSGHQAVQFAAQGVVAGAYEVVVAGGVESMSRVPMGSSMLDGRHGHPFGPRVVARYAGAGGLVPGGVSGELVAERWGLERIDLDRYASMSHERAVRAVADGCFDPEIVPVIGHGAEDVATDEGIASASVAELGLFPPLFVRGSGRITAGNAAPIADGAAALLIMSDERAASLGVRPRARFVAVAVAGDDPRLTSVASIRATRTALSRAGLDVSDIDRFEVDEPFASSVLAWHRGTDADLDRVNVNGGSIALGRPVGAAGARSMVTLLSELERIGGRFGLQAAGTIGGTGIATIVQVVR